MKKIVSIYFIAIFFFMSCKNEQDEMIPINSILDSGYELNNRTLNKCKGDYYKIIKDYPKLKVIELNELDVKFEFLISKIDSLIVDKTNNLKNINLELDEMFNEFPSLVDHKKEFLLPEFIKPETDSNELYLKYIKNRLVIAMTYAFKYNSEVPYIYCGIRRYYVNSVITEKNENSINLTLSSNDGQKEEENKELIINNVLFEGVEKNIKYNLTDNYSFVDIELYSLQKGDYQINGVLRFYDREGKIDVPFEKEFKIE